MKRGRYNIILPKSDIIKKFNIYQDQNSHYGYYFIYFEGDYVRIEKYKKYRGGWLWRLVNDDRSDER